MAKGIGQGNDVIVWNSGGLAMVRPLTDEASAWVQDNVVDRGDDLQWLGSSFAVEPRYIGDLVAGMRAAGLVVA